MTGRRGGGRHGWRIALACLLLSTVGACRSDGDDTTPAEEVRLTVVTTVSPITSIAAAVIGDAADIEGLVPEGTNSHTFEPPPSAAEAMAAADVMFINGLSLEEPIKRLAEANMVQGSILVELGSQAIAEGEYRYDISFPKEGGKPNPHLWTDPGLARTYARLVRDTMLQRDRGAAETYRKGYDAFSASVDKLDAALKTALATVPAERRKLLTYHDAYAYLDESYGLDVIGAIQVADFDEPSAKEVADLIEQVRAQGVPAIFGSEVFPSPVLERIGKETGVRYVDTLRDDDLPGAPGEPEHSWFGLMIENYSTITESLGGNASALRSLDLPDPRDSAEYPQ